MAKKQSSAKSVDDGPALDGAGTKLAVQQSCVMHSLQMQLRERSFAAFAALEDRAAMAEKLNVAEKALEAERQSHASTRIDMTGTHRRVQGSLSDEIIRLSRGIQELQDEVAEKERHVDSLRAQHVAAIARKDGDIVVLKAKMDDMAQEFNGMLSDTLERMGQRLELVDAEPTRRPLNMDTKYVFKWSSPPATTTSP
jgi:hypothetical protein